jgi:hypothetical protein
MPISETPSPKGDENNKPLTDQQLLNSLQNLNKTELDLAQIMAAERGIPYAEALQELYEIDAELDEEEKNEKNKPKQS